MRFYATVLFALGSCLVGLLGTRGDWPVDISPCDASNPTQFFAEELLNGEWQMIGDGSTAQSGSCLTTASCEVDQSTGDIVLRPCGQTECQNGADQLWMLDQATGYLIANVTGPKKLQWCATLQSVTGPAVNLWPCNPKDDNTKWDTKHVGTSSVQLSTREAAANFWCLTREQPPIGGVAIVANASAMSLQYDGMGGLAAVGGARLLYEYPEPQRSQILDLMFNASGGAAMQILKTEQQGDVDSSYGSGPSYAHTRDDNDINRGIYLPWLIQEAKKRRPDIVLYTLSWGTPYWVGNGSYYSQDGIDYHLGYLKAARSELGVTFDYAGIWNEMAWERSYIKDLRAALDASGFNSTQIVMPDGGDGKCTDCPTSWGDGAASALNKDPELAQAVAVLGLHTADPEGVQYSTASSLPSGIRFWNSENNVIDGPQPQFEPVPEQPYGSGLGWPRVMITNYVRGGATATILCPIMHSWSWNMGRQNHGYAQVTQPWSGAAEFGSAFWSQAHFTQLTEVGWRFVDGGGSGELCSSSAADGSTRRTSKVHFAEDTRGSLNGDGSAPDCDLVWATLAPEDQSQVTIVAVNSGLEPMPLAIRFTGALLKAAQQAGTLAVWQTDETAYFSQQQSVPSPLSEDQALSFTMAPRSVISISTVKTASRANYDSPKRKPVSLPLFRGFDDQTVGEPGRSLSDVFGGFTVAKDLSTNSTNQVLWQGAPTNPLENSWHGKTNGAPITTLYAGTNFANVNVSADLLLHIPPAARMGGPDGSGIEHVGRVCGRMPVWQPFGFQSSEIALGVCAVVTVPSSSSSSNSSSRQAASGGVTLSITQATKSSQVTLASVALPSVQSASVWLSIQLSVVGGTAIAQAGIRGGVTTSVQTDKISLPTGVAAVGFGWHTGYVDNFVVQEAIADSVPPAGSFLFEVLTGELYAPVDGWAGLVLNMSSAESDLTVTQLARFVAAGNTRTHNLTVIDAATGTSMLPGGTASIDAASCTQDFMGFCYSETFPAITLLRGGVYYIVSSEDSKGDTTLEMTDPCRGTTHANRDGLTIMSYAGPGKGEVTGRVSQSSNGSWTAITGLDGIDTSFGPVNFVMA